MISYFARLTALAAAIPAAFAASAPHLKVRNPMTADVVPDSISLFIIAMLMLL
jgi:hypothetical protein